MLPYKTEVATIFLQMLLILILDKNVPLHPNSRYYQMYISKRHKKCYYYYYYQATQTGFLDLKQYHSLEHAETKKYMFLFRYLFC